MNHGVCACFSTAIANMHTEIIDYYCEYLTEAEYEETKG